MEVRAGAELNQANALSQGDSISLPVPANNTACNKPGNLHYPEILSRIGQNVDSILLVGLGGILIERSQELAWFVFRFLDSARYGERLI
jgi:hypothetical protein